MTNIHLKNSINDNCALILGGGLNGYSTARELYECGVKNIFLTETHTDFVFYSNKITKSFISPANHIDIKRLIESLRQEYTIVVVYPTSDVYVSELAIVCNDMKNQTGIVCNPKSINNFFKKSDQFKLCSKHDIPYPRSMLLKDYFSNDMVGLTYPILIKPNYCDEINYGNVFKTLIIQTINELVDAKHVLDELINSGIDLLVTELIPGDDDMIYGYAAYRSTNGDIVNEWGCKKLSQFPEYHGVFSSITNDCSDEVMELGRKIFEKMDIIGMGDIEFKYDARDGKYKYIETNFRTPMFHRIGHLSGVNLCYTQFLDCIGENPVPEVINSKIHLNYVYLPSEIINFLRRPKYISKLFRNIFKSNKTYFAIFDILDPIPSVMNIFYTIICAKSLMKRFG